MHHARLILRSRAKRGVDAVAHPGRHGSRHFQVARGDRIALLVVGHGNLSHPLSEVGQVRDDGKNGHEFGTDSDAELGLHHVAILLAADADDDVAQRLGAEIHDPAHLDAGGVDVQAALMLSF